MALIMNTARSYWLCAVLCAAAGLAQNPAALFEKAPPDIDAALRARVTQFYQFHVDGKFRAADALVAEDSKDFFFSADKPRCRGFQIVSIKYAENYSQALVVISCDTDMAMPMAGRIPVKVPTRSQWKTVDGQWMWYVEPASDKGVVTPFGVRPPQQPQQSRRSTGVPMKPVDPASLAKLVTADKRRITFNSAVAGEERVVVTNGMPGSVSLKIEPAQRPGLTFTLDRPSLGRGQSAVLTIRYEPDMERRPSSTEVRVVASPLGQVIPIQIRFSAAPPAPRAE